jgi:hypothetical protein
MIPTIVWGTGNVGRSAIRAVEAHPALKLTGVLVHNPQKVGRDAGTLAGLDYEVGVAATGDIDAMLASSPRAVVYAASGDIRPGDALADIIKAIRAGAVVVTPALYALYDPRNAPPELRDPVLAAIAEGGGSLFVSGVDPGWGNDVLPVLLSGLGHTVDVIRCQEIFDYSTYDQPDSVRYLVGMGQPMDYQPPMTAPGIPTMVWGGQIRLMARALGVELDEIRETLTGARSRTPSPRRPWVNSRRAARARCGSRCRASSRASRASSSSTSPGSTRPAHRTGRRRPTARARIA